MNYEKILASILHDYKEKIKSLSFTLENIDEQEEPRRFWKVVGMKRGFEYALWGLEIEMGIYE